MRWIAFLMAAMLLLGGCGSAEPKEPRPTPTAAPTATLTAPTMPPEAKEDSKAGAIAFVKHYIDVFNYASNTGDVKELQRLSDPKCEGCNSYITLYKGTYAAGGYYRDSDWSVSNPQIEKQGADLVVFIHADAPQGTFKATKSDKARSGGAEDIDLAFVPALGSSGWKMLEFGKQENRK